MYNIYIYIYRVWSFVPLPAAVRDALVADPAWVPDLIRFLLFLFTFIFIFSFIYLFLIFRMYNVV